MTEKKKSTQNPKLIWKKLSEHKPTPFNLVTLRDAEGKQQIGWWTGQGFDFSKQRISDPIEFKTDHEPLFNPVREWESTPKVYSAPGCRDGRVGIRKYSH